MRQSMFEAELYTLRDLMVHHCVKRVPFMKLDCESCEWSVVNKWNQTGELSKIDAIVGELHSGLNPPEEISLENALRVYYSMCQHPERFLKVKGCPPDRKKPVLSYIEQKSGKK